MVRTMDTQTLIEIQIALKLAAKAILELEQDVKEINSILDSLERTQITTNSKFDTGDARNFKEVYYDVQRFKEQMILAQQRMMGLSIGLVIAILTGIITLGVNVWSSHLIQSPTQVQSPTLKQEIKK
jgi:hypothetical protein